MEKDIFLTFDMDWASDEVLQDFYDLICELDVCGTIHVTHDTELLDIFRRDGRLELGIHPNYNMLLDGTAEADSSESVIARLKEIVPDAVTVRAHCLTAGSRISNLYAKHGLKYDLNMFYPPKHGDCIQCFHNIAGLINIPFIFEDDIYMMYTEKENMTFYLGGVFLAPRVFNFHPIHIFLNTDNFKRYENARPYFKDYKRLKDYRNDVNIGAREWLMEIVSIAKSEGYTFKKIKDGNWQ